MRAAARRVHRCSVCVEGLGGVSCPRLEEVAALELERDALGADIHAHERARSMIEESLADSRRRRVEIDARLAELRGAP